VVACSRYPPLVSAALTACLTVLAAAPSAAARPAAHVEGSAVVERIGFEEARVGKPWPDDTTFGAWYSLHNGFGLTQIESNDAARTLTLTTRAPEVATETYSSLVHTRRTFGDVDFTVSLRTVAQLRRPVPNPWEVAWVLWRYTDNQHFYSFIVKPNGWELAKQDVSYRGSQRFLAYSDERLFPVGQTYRIRVQHVGNTISVWVDDVRIVRFTDRERPHRSGSIALYAEDSSVRYSPVALRSIDR
jgi:Domain of Unknown Function (DUF1080)